MWFCQRARTKKGIRKSRRNCEFGRGGIVLGHLVKVCIGCRDSRKGAFVLGVFLDLAKAYFIPGARSVNSGPKYVQMSYLPAKRKDNR